MMIAEVRKGKSKPGQVTVMVPSYNYARYLPDCVASAATQRGVEVDVAIVDSGSTDESVAVARSLEAQYPNVRLKVYPDNQGIITSFNRCREEVRGEFAVLLCADDCLTPGSVARSVAFMKAHPAVGMVYGPCSDFAELAEVDQQLYLTRERPPIVYPGTGWIERRCRTASNSVGNPAVLMRTSVIDTVGLLEASCTHTSDLNMWLRIASHSDVAFLPGPPQALFRKHAANFSSAYLRPGARHLDIAQRWQAFAKFFDTLADQTLRNRWESMVRTALAAEARYVATRVYDQSSDGVDPAIEELIAFAATLDPAAMSVVEHWSWRLRRAIGPRYARLFPGFWIRPAMRRVGREVFERRWTQVGV